jgi:hypothetical protein
MSTDVSEVHALMVEAALTSEMSVDIRLHGNTSQKTLNFGFLCNYYAIFTKICPDITILAQLIENDGQ